MKKNFRSVLKTGFFLFYQEGNEPNQKGRFCFSAALFAIINSKDACASKSNSKKGVITS